MLTLIQTVVKKKMKMKIDRQIDRITIERWGLNMSS
jgi:hypothetical protein